MANAVRETRSTLDRMRGLIGRPLRAGEALLIARCSQVHTFGMTEPIDVIFCDNGSRVLHVTRGMRPRRISCFWWKARSVIELRAGGAREVSRGDQLRLSDTERSEG